MVSTSVGAMAVLFLLM